MFREPRRRDTLEQVYAARYGSTAPWFPTTVLQPRPRPPRRPPARPVVAGSVVLGHDRATGAPVQLAPIPRMKGLYLLGIQGMGKSSEMRALIEQDVQQGFGLCLLDPHRDLVDDLLPLVPPEREDDVVLLDVRQGHTLGRSFGLNLFDCRDRQNELVVDETRQRIMRVFERIWGSETDKPPLGVNTEELLSMLTATCIDNPGTTFADLPTILVDAAFRDRLVRHVSNPDVRRFWAQSYDAMNEGQQRRYADPTRKRVDRFLDRPVIKRIVSQRRTTFDIRDCLANNRILLVQLDPKLADLTAFIGALIIELIGDAAFDRAATARSPFFLYADECQLFATSAFPLLIPQIRKFGVGCVLANQWRRQFPAAHHPMREATAGMGSMVVFRTKPDDAREMAEHFSTTPQPRRQVVLDPLAVLERQGHPDSAIQGLVRRLSQLLVQERARLEHEVAHDRDQRRWTGGAAPVSVGAQLAALRAAITLYLAEAMEQRALPEPAVGQGALAAAVEDLAERLLRAPLTVPAADQIASRAEQRAALEDELKGQDPFCARCTVLLSADGVHERRAEYSIRTAPFQPAAQDATTLARVARLRARSATLYGTPIAVIDAENEERAAALPDADAPVRAPVADPAPAVLVDEELLDETEW